MAQPNIPDINTLIQAGINPKTNLPFKFGITEDGFRDANLRLLTVIDRQDAINRFTWYNLPNGLTGDMIERILYFKGQGAFFYMKETDQFYFLPYTLDGNIDVYGRYTGITPLTFGSGAKDEKPWIKDLIFKPIYDIKLDFVKPEDIFTNCVLLRDYSNDISETILPRVELNRPLLGMMADVLPYCHTALKLATGVKGMRVNNEADYSNVMAANSQIQKAALSGDGFIPIVGGIEFQELTGDVPAKSEEYLMVLQALDNYRLSMYGLETGGLFQKKSHMLEAEQTMNAGHASLALQDGLTQRQNFCDRLNSIYGLGVWCEPSEAAIGADMNMDGISADNNPDTPSYNGGNSNGGETYAE